MWTKILNKTLQNVTQIGRLEVTWPDKSKTTYGNQDSLRAAITLTDPALPRKLVLNPELALGEAYMDGTLTVENDDLPSMLDLLTRNAAAAGHGRFQNSGAISRAAWRWLQQRNPLQKARQNVELHYDLSVDLYDLFLCDDKQYTCAYFNSPDMTLEAAQAAKKAHIATKLQIKPGMRVLDIGCGWGGTSITLARDFGANVVGVTLSQVQLDHAKKRAEAAGVADKIEFRLTDYRDVVEEFDRIVVVGMLEHVGQPQYATFFRQIERNLAPEGIALVHTIGRPTPPGRTSPFMLKYIFPGGYAPAMSEILTEVEKTSLGMTDVEVWRGHYEQTLQHWQQRFLENRDEIRALYDERFCRMWYYYLVAAENGFANLGQAVFQFQITKNPAAAPATRDYLYRP